MRGPADKDQMTRVKICGITRIHDALHAVESGADALGFNFYRGSSRYISPEAAAEMISKNSGEVLNVGVFVNEPIESIIQIENASGINAIQLHGDESAEFVSELRSRTNSRLIKAFRVGPGFDRNAIAEYDVDAVLLDAFSPQERGGTGEVFDWEIAAALAAEIPTLFLAGGLDPDNVADAIRQVRPYAVDVASGVEASKGIKDSEKVSAFIRNAKSA